MRKERDTISIYINSSIDTLTDRSKKELISGSINELKNRITKDVDITLYFVNHITNREKFIATVKSIKEFDTEVCSMKCDLYKLMQVRLKYRYQLESKHYLVLFSKPEDELITNENNYSYFYNLDSLLSGSFLDDLLSKVEVK